MFESTEALLEVPQGLASSSALKVPPEVALRLPRVVVAAVDLLALGTAWLVTCELRVLSNGFFRRQLSFAQTAEIAPPLLALLALWMLLEIRDWMQAPEALRRVGHGVVEILERALVAGLLAIVATFFSRHFGAELSRSFVVFFLPVSFFCLIIGRYGLALAGRAFRTYWPNAERVAILGRMENAKAIAAAFEKSDPGFRVVGLIADDCELTDDEAFTGNGTAKVLGRTHDLAALINTAHLQRIVFADGDLQKDVLDRCSKIATRMNVVLNMIVDVPAARLATKIDDRCGAHLNQHGLGLLRLHSTVRTPWQNATKRAIDLGGSLALLVLLAPLLLAIALLIRLSSPGPVLYRSRRVGKGGRHFTFLKFRSMYVAADRARDQVGANEKAGHIFKMRNDPRVTSVGRVLRRTSLDELPQLLNILRGEMSLVGPRPLPARDLDPDGMSQLFANWAEQRATVLPGITGLWQVRGRSDLSFEDMVNFDLEYIRCWSLRCDLRILIETPLALFTGSGAY